MIEVINSICKQDTLWHETALLETETACIIILNSVLEKNRTETYSIKTQATRRWRKSTGIIQTNIIQTHKKKEKQTKQKNNNYILYCLQYNEI